jgi:hypothetical protein
LISVKRVAIALSSLSPFQPLDDPLDAVDRHGEVQIGQLGTAR